MKAVRFKHTYDVDRLRIDLEAAEQHGQWIIGSTGQEVWQALPLVSRLGSGDTDEAIRYWSWQGDEVNQYQPTEALRFCPYFLSVIDSFQCLKERVRLMRLPAKESILKHSDVPGKSRFHIPIITHEEIYFFIENTRIEMGPGELWDIDLTREHEVHNKSPIDRIHLVMDLVPNAWLTEFVAAEATHTIE